MRMNRRTFVKNAAALAVPPLLPLAARAQTPPAPHWPFFAFDNGVGRGKWPPEKQAATLKALGYDGISYNYTDNKDLETWLRVYRDAGLSIFGLYVHTFPGKKDAPWPPALRDAVAMLKGSKTVLWITFRETKDKADHDDACAAIARELGDLAQAAGIRVAVYPHAGFYVETASQALRVARKAAHPAVGPSYNLCHEFLTGNGGTAMETLRAVAPESLLLSINGVDPSDRKRFILPLGEGAFDTRALLAELKRLGYRGPVGHQFYNIPGDTETILQTAIAAWRRQQPRS
jgi:sugar phosphate isomerase/epimerase